MRRSPCRREYMVRTVDGGTTRSHADHSVRRDCLWHAAVRAGMRAVGHARTDEFRQSRPWLIRHGGRLHHAGAGQPRRRAVLRRASHRLHRHRADRRAVRAHALCARLQQEPPRPGAVHHRSGVHVGRRRRLRDGLAAGLHRDPERAAGALRDLRHRRGALSAADHRRLRAAHGGPAAHPLEHPLRQPAARVGRRRAGRARPRHQRQRGLHLDLRVRVGPGRPWRGARRRDSRPRSDLSAQIHGLLSDRGDGRRHVQHHRSVRRLAADRHRRRGGQVLRPQIRGVRDLHHHDHRPACCVRRACSPARAASSAESRDVVVCRRTRSPTISPRAPAGARSNTSSGWRRWRACSCCPDGT